MDKINFYNQSTPSFGNKLQLTRIADDAINARINKMPASARKRTLEQFDKLIRRIVNSDYDVFVTGDKKTLVANVAKQSKVETLSTERSTDSVLFKFGLKSPIEFIETAFNRLAKSNEKAATSEAVNLVLTKKL